ncbi:nuclear transport factor 2 family protein [Sphingomonas profundi]|uniref:nuclear transport factor 2 family protein n=1 Tax=Alterirhizorhabdus profundi TaxID=2681549 RepID=UPI001E2F7340|nr:nuclear transport factor 2 family protein [Sphingomonas profundi]
MNDDLECTVACERLAIASYSLMDHGRYDAAVALFTKDGVWVRGGVPCAGRDAILASLNQRPEGDISRHIVTNVLVTRISDTEADATALFVPLRGRPDEQGIAPLSPAAMIGDLVFRFERVAGVWLIRELRPRPVFKA